MAFIISCTKKNLSIVLKDSPPSKNEQKSQGAGKTLFAILYTFYQIVLKFYFNDAKNLSFFS